MSIIEQIEILEKQRNIIQSLDEQILSLLEQRIAAAKIIGDIKKKNNKPIYVPEVETRKIATLSAASAYPGLVETIWPVIMCYTRSIE